MSLVDILVYLLQFQVRIEDNAFYYMLEVYDDVSKRYLQIFL